MRHFYILFCLIVSIHISFSQTTPQPVLSVKQVTQEVWVDSIYNQFSFEEKVGQLFMVAAYSNKDEAHNKSIDKLVEEYKIGGVIFFQGGPVRQAKLTNRYQAKSKVPLFVGIDAEWGLSMRLDSTYRYPWNMTLGAVQDMKLIEKAGNQMAIQSKRMGIHFNFAPVVDINTNPKNPIIGNRSFGETKENVTMRALALMKGLQDEGVFATAKHFPGHGDTSTDSHHTLPVVNFDRNRLNEVELYPYKELIKNGLTSVMVAHLNVPSIEPRENYPTSISYPVVTDILKKELQFEGLIFTDALNMKGASNFKKPGDIDLEAFIAGNDVLLFAENVPVAIKKFKDAFDALNALVVAGGDVLPSSNPPFMEFDPNNLVCILSCSVALNTFT
jgi:beta-glucosidase-like glycosyl hydrolase